MWFLSLILNIRNCIINKFWFINIYLLKKMKLWNGWVLLRFFDFFLNKYYVYNVNKLVIDIKILFEIDKIILYRVWR